MFDMSQQRQNKMGTEEFGDTSYSKIFVGGLAWETQTDTMKNYFAQFGEILEAVIITDRITGKSKGYGFVVFTSLSSFFRSLFFFFFLISPSNNMKLVNSYAVNFVFVHEIFR